MNVFLHAYGLSYSSLINFIQKLTVSSENQLNSSKQIEKCKIEPPFNPEKNVLNKLLQNVIPQK